MNNTELEKLKIVEADMLREFITICDKFKLRYFILYGTCLGAVRHQGFIPWDDDIDVGMPRPDYIKFLEIAQTELSDHIFLQNYHTEKEFFCNFSKLRNSHTIFLEKGVENMRINHGVYIDIFPLDGVADSRIIRWGCAGLVGILNRMLLAIHLSSYNNMNLLKRTAVGVAYLFFRPHLVPFFSNFSFRLISPIFVHKLIDHIVQRYGYEQSSLVRSYFGAWGDRETMARETFGNGCPLLFDEMVVTGPENPDSYLKSMYGNYMIPPPEDKQVSTHATVKISFCK